MRVNSIVKNKSLIQTDDRENGHDDGSPIVQPGTLGVVVAKSSEMIEEGYQLKAGAENSLVVKFEGCDIAFDCLPNELEQVIPLFLTLDQISHILYSLNFLESNSILKNKEEHKNIDTELRNAILQEMAQENQDMGLYTEPKQHKCCGGKCKK